MVQRTATEPRRCRAEPVDQPVLEVRSAGVLGEIRGAASAEGHRFVLEPAHRRDRHRVPAFDRVDLEDVAVAPSEIGEALLAAQPRPPRRRTTGAVVDRTGQADPRRLHSAARADEQCRRATGVDVCVVGHVGGVRHRGETFVGHVVGFQLVVADERDAAAPCREGRHAVMRGRDRRAVVEHVDRLARQDLVAEPTWQIEQAGGVRLEIAIARAVGPSQRRWRRQQATERSAEGESGAGSGQAEEATSVECHHQRAYATSVNTAGPSGDRPMTDRRTLLTKRGGRHRRGSRTIASS